METIVEESFVDGLLWILEQILESIRKIQEVEYAEVITCIAAQNADDQMRSHIDECMMKIKNHLELSGAKQGKSIFLLNPAIPPIVMTNTIYIQITDAEQEPLWNVQKQDTQEADVQELNLYSEQMRHFKEQEILDVVKRTAASIQEDVPSFRFKTEPFIKGNLLTLLTEGGISQ